MIKVSLHESLSGLTPEEWDGCARSGTSSHAPDPFTSYRFLHGLESSGSVGGDSGWIPCHLVAREHKEVFAVLPLYAKLHSQGEFVFDHGWAHAFEHAGGSYYPKLQASVPFTPVTGRRFLSKPGQEEAAFETLLKAAVTLAVNNEMSSLHVTFCDEDEMLMGRKLGLLCRSGEQFHWFNRDYETFDDFLATLSSRKRKNIRRERRRAAGFGGSIHRLTGDAIRSEHMDAVWAFYQDTGARKWGRPYLTRSFFDAIHDTMRDQMLLVLCERQGNLVAGALNFIGQDALFGRYWGCLEHHDCLHFEVCYYQAIEHAIACGLKRIEAGAGGPHKLARGYVPVKTHSLHWIANPALRRAVADFVEAEAVEVETEIAYLSTKAPYRKVGGQWKL